MDVTRDLVVLLWDVVVLPSVKILQQAYSPRSRVVVPDPRVLSSSVACRRLVYERPTEPFGSLYFFLHADFDSPHSHPTENSFSFIHGTASFL